MSYRIEYRFPAEKKKNFFRCSVLTVLFFLFFLFLVSRCWPEGYDLIRSLFHRVKNSAAVTALERFTKILSEGETIRESFSEFLNGLLP